MAQTSLFLLDTAWRAAIVFLTVAVMAMTAQAAIFNRPLFRALEGKPPVAPFFTSVTALFALFVAFAAADAWNRQERAAEALGQEARALMAFHAASESLGREGEPLRAAFSDYLTISLQDEWTASHNLEPSAAATTALRQLEDVSMLGMRHAGERGDTNAVWPELLRRVQELRAARDVRLRLGSDFGQPWKWGGLLLLAFASQLGIAVVHLDRPRTAALAQVIFLAGATTTLSVVAGFEGPYAGISAVAPTPLLALQEAIAAR
jgi:hypothetical protein